MSVPTHHTTPMPASAPGPSAAIASDAAPWEGRAFGGIVLAAFVLYGVGSGLADQPIGMALVLLNSIAVAFAGLIGFRLARGRDSGVGRGYLAARAAEAILLAGGVILAQYGDIANADTDGYLLAMMALGVGSIPFCRTLGRRRWIPQPLATWGIVGYGALVLGAGLELTTGRSLAVVFAVPGGLFELALGVFLLRYGFRRPPGRRGGETAHFL